MNDIMKNINQTSLKTECEHTGKRKRKSILKEVIRCRGCWFVFKYNGTTVYTKCPNCGKKLNACDRTQEAKLYYQKHPEIMVTFENSKKKKDKRTPSADNLHRSVLYVVAGTTDVKCKCGCNDIRFLEINHINGGGTKEFRAKGSRVYWDIIQHKRPVDDLEVMCKVCNALHYLELKYGKLPFNITYDKKEEI
jgi:predicted Zn-ribbon and HTH transcriptional regulator